MDIVIAWLLIPAGILMIIKSDKVVDFTGEFSSVENFLGAGGTYTFIKLMGLLTSILAFMWITGGLQGVMLAVFGPFFGLQR